MRRGLAIAVCWCLAMGLTARAEDVVGAAGDAPVEPELAASDREHWGYVPPADVRPPESNDPRWGAHPVDRFLKQGMAQAGVTPLPRAGRATLLRRLTFDLTGLPPTPDEVRAYLADENADAYERVVERLLASRAYGERYAQHWLDLARYAETDGFEHDLVRPNAWRYRDWVIASLESDMPFDEFARLQIAGDLLRPDDPPAAVATGFLLCGPDMPDINSQDERRHFVLNEMTSTVGAVFLAMQIGCAQCHDHKYDPISQHDFYRLRACFEGAELFDEKPIPTPAEQAAHDAAVATWTDGDRQAKKRCNELWELGRKRFRDKNPDERPSEAQVRGEWSDAEREEHDTLAARVAKLPKAPELPRGRVVREGAQREAHLWLRGDFRRPGPVVEPGYPRVLCGSGEAPTEGRAARVELAEWLTGGPAPPTARVIVNRVWQWHFGVGLAETTSDFGLMGSPPEQSELLDWLARWFVADGWSLKRLHRLLVTSEAYRLASGPYDAGWTVDERDAAGAIWQSSSERDGYNRTLWRRVRQRLDGETIRDALLATCGRLATRRGGPGVRPPLPVEVTETLLKDQWRTSRDEKDHRRRSVYLFVRRNLRFPLLDVFDRPDTLTSCPQRHQSVMATQALVLLNSAFSLDCAQHLAGRAWRAAPGERRGQIAEVYLAVLGRMPSEADIELASGFLVSQAELLSKESRSGEQPALPEGVALDQGGPAKAALIDFCLALMNSSETIYVD